MSYKHYTLEAPMDSLSLKLLYRPQFLWLCSPDPGFHGQEHTLCLPRTESLGFAMISKRRYTFRVEGDLDIVHRSPKSHPDCMGCYALWSYDAFTRLHVARDQAP